MSKIEVIRELTEECTENCKVYELSNGQRRAVYTLSDEPRERSTQTTGNAPITCYAYNTLTGEATTSEIVHVNYDTKTHLVFALNLSGYGSGYKTITSAVLRFKTTGGSGRIKAFRTSEGFNGQYIIESGTCLDYYQLCTVDGANCCEVNLAGAIADDPDTTHYFTASSTDGSSTMSIYTERSADDDDKPQLIVDYIPRNDYAKNQKTITGNADNAGEYEVNIRTGRLTLAKSLMAFGGNLMPLTVDICFDEEYVNTQTVGKNTYFPKGWKLNYQQYCYLSGGKYIYIDGLFKKHVFESTATETTPSNVYYDTCGTRLLLTVETDGIKIKDGLGKTLIFTDGYLTKIKDNSSSQEIITTISYDSSWKLTGVTDGMGRVLEIEYNDSNSTITLGYNNETVVLSYNSNKLLTGITEIDGKTVSYGYLTETSGLFPFARKPNLNFTTHKFQTATGSTGKKVKFTFNSSNRVNKIEEFVGANATKTYNLDYGCRHTVVNSGKNGGSTTYNTVYDYDENGEFFAEYERKNINQAYGGEYRTKEPYIRLKTSSAGQKIIDISGAGTYSLEDDDGEVLGSKSMAGLGNFCSFVFCGKATLQSVSRPKKGVGSKVNLILKKDGQQLTEIQFNPFVTGQQTACGFFELQAAEYNDVYVELSSSGFGDVKIAELEIWAIPQQINGDYVNVNTGETSIVETGAGTTWYAMKNCTVKYGTTELTDVKMTVADILATQESKQKGENGLWYNDGQNYVPNVENIVLNYGNGDVNISSIQVANIRITGNYAIFEKTVINTGGESLTTIHTVGVGEDKICTVNRDEKRRLISETDSKGATTSYTYDTYGNVIKTRKALSGEDGIVYEQSYGENGHELVSQTEYFGNKAKTESYTYDSTTGNLTKTIYSNAQEENYTYATNNKDITKISALVGESLNENEIEYTQNGLVSAVKHNNFSYGFTYDDRNNVNAIQVAGQTILTLASDYGTTNETVTVTYANGATKYREYDKYGRVLKEGESANSIDWTYIYCDETDEETLQEATSTANLTVTATSPLKKRYSSSGSEYYEYDEIGRIKKEKLIGKTVTYTYNGETLDEKVVEIGTDTWEESYTYTLEDDLNGNYSLTGVQTQIGGKEYALSVQHDGYGRTASKRTVLENCELEATYSYATRMQPAGENGTTERVADVLYRLNDNTTAYRDGIAYDVSGNIQTHISLGSGSVATTTYTYDGLNRLIREDNSALEQTYTYSYDVGGNITSKKTYSYTTGDLDGESYSEKTYTYDTTNKDRLISWNNKSFSYDSYGNPTAYKGKACAWTKGTLLSEYGTTTMTYGKDGERTGKTVERRIEGTIPMQFETETTSYTWVGDKLYKEIRTKGTSTTTLKYVYAGDELVGFFLNGTAYLYRKNVFGDIVGILNSNGVEVAKYAYDAWGHCLIQLNSSGIATTNPFRYRGYYYDKDLGLYYLKTRYYDAETGRFISPDSPKYLAPEILNGLNLYAYCNNNPVMNIDPNGNAWWEWLIAGVLIVGCVVGAVFTGGTSLVGAALIGAAIGGGVSIATQAITTGELNWGQFALDMGIGAISGAVGASSITRLGATIVGGALGGVSNVASQLVSGRGIDEINWLKVGVGAIIGGLASFLGGAGARNTAASNAAPKVQKAINSVNKVLSRQASGYYSSARYAQAALTNVANRLGKALAVQQAKMMAGALTWLGIGSAGFNFIDGFIGFFVSGW